MISGQMLSSRPRSRSTRNSGPTIASTGKKPGDQDEAEDRAGAADRQARERVAGERRDDDRDRPSSPAATIALLSERRQEALLGEVLAVGAAGEVRGDEAVGAADALADGRVGQQRGAQDPVEREQRDQDHDDAPRGRSSVSRTTVPRGATPPARRGAGAARAPTSAAGVADSVLTLDTRSCRITRMTTPGDHQARARRASPRSRRRSRSRCRRGTSAS